MHIYFLSFSSLLIFIGGHQHNSYNSVGQGTVQHMLCYDVFYIRRIVKFQDTAMFF